MGRKGVWVLGAVLGLAVLAAPATAQVSVAVGVGVPPVAASVVIGAPPVYAARSRIPPYHYYPYLTVSVSVSLLLPISRLLPGYYYGPRGPSYYPARAPYYYGGRAAYYGAPVLLSW